MIHLKVKVTGRPRIGGESQSEITWQLLGSLQPRCYGIASGALLPTVTLWRQMFGDQGKKSLFKNYTIWNNSFPQALVTYAYQLRLKSLTLVTALIT